MKKLIAIVAASVCAFSAQADTSGVYAGVEGFSSRLTDLGRTTGLGVFGGYRFGNGLAVEVNGNRIGKFDVSSIVPSGGSVSVNALSVSGIYALSLTDSLSLYGRLGYGTLRIANDEKLISRGYKLDNGMLYGIGANYQINKAIGVRAEFRKPASDISSVGLGLSYQF